MRIKCVTTQGGHRGVPVTQGRHDEHGCPSNCLHAQAGFLDSCTAHAYLHPKVNAFSFYLQHSSHWTYEANLGPNCSLTFSALHFPPLCPHLYQLFGAWRRAGKNVIWKLIHGSVCLWTWQRRDLLCAFWRSFPGTRLPLISLERSPDILEQMAFLVLCCQPFHLVSCGLGLSEGLCGQGHIRTWPLISARCFTTWEKSKSKSTYFVLKYVSCGTSRHYGLKS